MKRMLTFTLAWLIVMSGAVGSAAAEQVPDIADLLPPGGEMEAKDSIYDRWVAAVAEPNLVAVKRFMERNYVIRAGKPWASGKAESRLRLPVRRVLKQFLEADVIFFGESHDQAGAHMLEIFLTRLLYERCDKLVVCMEMFERQTQPLLDAYIAREIDEKTFLARLADPAMKGLWGNYAKDYRPIIEFCRDKGIPVVAAFPPRRLASTLARKGKEGFFENLSEANRRLCAGRIVEPTDPSYRNSCMRTFNSMGDFRRGAMLDMLEKDPSKLERFKPMILGTGGKMSGMGRVMSGSSERLFISQLLKDGTMAESIAQILKDRPGAKVLAIAGSGHVRYGGGAVGVLRVIAPQVKMVTSIFASPKTIAPSAEPGRAPADILFFGDSIRTYEQKLPSRVTLEEAKRRIALLEKLALLKLYRKNGHDQKKAMADIEKVRGLKYKFPVYASILTPEESKAEVGGWAENPKAKKYYAETEKVLRAFNLFTGKTSLSTKKAQKNREGIMGFYRPTDKTLYIFPHQSGQKKLWGLRVHETIHALQDQHFDLMKLHRSVKNSDDDAALTALIEGEAVYLMMKVIGMSRGLEKMLHGEKGMGKPKGMPKGMKRPKGMPKGMGRPKGMGGGMKGRPAAPPNYFGERTKLMYRYGAQFLKKLVDVGGWERVTEAFRNRPRTTAEILHPERYLAGFRPTPVVLPDPPEGWKVLRNDVLGEGDFIILCKLNKIKDKKARGVASGWRGDAYHLLVSTDDPALHRLVFLSTWDTVEAAEKARKLLAGVFPDAKVAARDCKVALVRELRLQ